MDHNVSRGAQADLSQAGCSTLRPLTADDVTAAENKGYDHGLRHGREEVADKLEAYERLKEAVLWALGESETDGFRPQVAGDPPYWWRRELREKAFPPEKPCEHRATKRTTRHFDDGTDSGVTLQGYTCRCGLKFQTTADGSNNQAETRHHD